MTDVDELGNTDCPCCGRDAEALCGDCYACPGSPHEDLCGF